jgi:hypothetical protein
MENLDHESKSQSQPEIFIFSEPRFPTGRNCLEEGKIHRVLFTQKSEYFILLTEIVSNESNVECLCHNY